MWRVILALLVFVMVMAAPTAVFRCQLSGALGETAVDPCAEGIQQVNLHLAQLGVSAVLLPWLAMPLPLLVIFRSSARRLIRPGNTHLPRWTPPPRPF